MTALPWTKPEKALQENKKPIFLMNIDIVSEWNPTICKRNNVPLSSIDYPGKWKAGLTFENLSIVYHINRWKEKNYIITSINADNVWWNTIPIPDENSRYMRKRKELDKKAFKKIYM